MIFRPLTVLCFLVAAGFGWNLFQVKHSTALLDRELAGIAEQIKAAQKQKETLESVWGTLNDLPRLRQLSQQLLPQEMSQTPQNRSFAELERRLPPAQAPEAMPSAFALREGASAPDIAIALLPPETLAPALLLASAMPPPPAAAPASVAAALPASAPLPVSKAPQADALAEEEALPLPPPAPPHLLAMAEPRAVLAATPRPVAAPAPRAALPATAAPAGPYAPPYTPAPIAYARPAQPTRPQSAPEPPAHSLLGGLGAPLLAPPVPFGSAHAATLGGYAR
jgi:hypothetical protein